MSNFELQNIPSHIAVVMDGNGRWAKKRGAARIFGHKNAIKAVRDTAETCARLGVQYLTLFAFSTENWNRPKYEVEALMQLLIRTIKSETATLMKNNIRLSAIGQVDKLPAQCQRELKEAMDATKNNDGMILSLALSYSGKWDMHQAIVALANDVHKGSLHPDDINMDVIDTYLATKDMPDPELVIRTSGEQRISNFLLWQIAYSELYFTEVLWPDFRKEHLLEALDAFNKRERRFGKTSEQLPNPSTT